MKKVYYWLTGILLFLIITNPTTRDFKEYLGDESYKGLKKEYNVFIYSKYKRGKTSYFAILGNFIKIDTNKLIKVNDTIPQLPKGFTPINDDTLPLPPSKKIDGKWTPPQDAVPAVKKTTEQSPKKLSVDEFAKKIKEKYPVYKDIDNTLLSQKIVEKYPEYKDKVDIPLKKMDRGNYQLPDMPPKKIKN